jgi:hypothetical protein
MRGDTWRGSYSGVDPQFPDRVLWRDLPLGGTERAYARLQCPKSISDVPNTSLPIVPLRDCTFEPYFPQLSQGFWDN